MGSTRIKRIRGLSTPSDYKLVYFKIYIQMQKFLLLHLFREKLIQNVETYTKNYSQLKILPYDVILEGKKSGLSQFQPRMFLNIAVS